jgi:hypothetical protein
MTSIVAQAPMLFTLWVATHLLAYLMGKGWPINTHQADTDCKLTISIRPKGDLHDNCTAAPDLEAHGQADHVK